ncbi:hypothetical protein MUG91_G282n7 [Manis pentadactyla]|nr:hypothetical protein MUG91_G282n7 [Manis pentadactyla]
MPGAVVRARSRRALRVMAAHAAVGCFSAWPQKVSVLPSRGPTNAFSHSRARAAKGSDLC